MKVKPDLKRVAKDDDYERFISYSKGKQSTHKRYKMP